MSAFAFEAPKPLSRPGRNTPLSFPRDSNRRRRLFHPDSFKHHAKANLFMLGYLVDALTRPGDLVIDPMGGTGSLFIGAAARRRVLCGEIEKWLRPVLSANRQRAASWGSGGRAWGAQWDANHLPLPAESVQAVITSPPYWDTFSDWHITSNRLLTDTNKYMGPHGSAYGDDRYSETKTNLGNIHTYEKFLAAMRPVFGECWRVLAPAGALALIVKDRIHRGRRVPIGDDLAGLCQALGFQLVGIQDVRARLTQYRQVHKAKGQQTIEDEQLITLRKTALRIPRKWALVAVPSKSGPPAIVYQKAMRHAGEWAADVWALVPGRGLVKPERAPRSTPQSVEPHQVRARWCFDVVNDLANRGLRFGDQVLLHVPERYAPYLQERLETFGVEVWNPTAHLNLGQKMAWLTRIE